MLDKMTTNEITDEKSHEPRSKPVSKPMSSFECKVSESLENTEEEVNFMKVEETCPQIQTTCYDEDPRQDNLNEYEFRKKD